MLLRFAVENHRSIRERQELSFAASTLKDRADGLIPCDAVKSRAVVPAAVIYGANASGKTNMVNAMETMQWMVLWSHVKGGPGSGVPRRKFMLDPDWAEKPSSFEIDFVLDGVRYHYGFEATDKAFSSEWLYESPRAHSRKLFERQEQQFEFGRGLKGQNQSIAKLARPNSLFVSAAAQNGHELLTHIYEYFRNMIFTGTHSKSHIEKSTLLESGTIALENADIDDRVINFLNSIDTGICGFQRMPTLVSERAGQHFHHAIEEGHAHYVVPPEFREGEAQKIEEPVFAHQGKNGEKVCFTLDLESSGTLRMLAILGKAFEAIDEGVPVIVDEVDLSLHTAASEAILRLFCSRELNRNGAQILATMHDTNLMKSEVFRRDQLWFAEKSKDGSTEIYPLTDFRTRKDDNIELGYRQGRYGAVPNNDPVALPLEN
ncbi:MAG: ATP-binding protein [Rhodobacter sp.]|nr:ATP-binding protein [Rhodobacter sp.]